MVEKRSVLLIGDNHPVSELLHSLYESGDGIIVCHTLHDALQQLPADFFIVITHLSLPDSTAEQTFDAVQHRFSPLPVIVISAGAEEDLATQAIADGAQEYLLEEELNKRTLTKAIDSAINRKINVGDYERLFDESPVPMYIYEPDTLCFLAANEACLAQYGFSKKEFLSLTADDIRAEKEVAVFRSLTTSIPDQYHDFGRWTHIRKNGQFFIAHIYAHSTRFHGKAAILITAVDVDRIVRAEGELKEKNKEISNILESITDGFFALNAQGEFTYVNKECEKIFGLRRKQMIGKNIREIYDENEYADLYIHFRSATENGINMRYEGYLAAVGKWLSVTAYPTKNGLAVYLVDVTEWRKIRQQLLHDEQQLRAIINNTHDMIWSVDENRNIIVANDAFRKRMQQLNGYISGSILPQAMITSWQSYFEKAFIGQALTFTWQDNIGDKVFYDEVSLYPIRNEHNTVIGVSCFSRDITRQQLRLQKIQLQNEYLEKAAWMHSHEVRGPVANIMGLTSLLDMSDPDDPDNITMLELIVESAHQLDKAIRKIAAHIDDYQLSYEDEEE